MFDVFATLLLRAVRSAFVRLVLRYTFVTLAEILFAAVLFPLLLGSPERLHYYRAVARTWYAALAALSQTNLSFLAYSIIAPIIGFVVVLVLLRHPSQEAAMPQVKDLMVGVAAGLAVPLLIMATVFVWNIPKTIYNDHLALVALEGKNKTLSADLEWRKHSVSTTDPVFPNIIYLLQAFQIYRHAQGGAPCVVKVTAPRGRGAAMASMVAQFSSSVSGCFTFGPDMNFDLNPDLEKQATDGMVSDAIVFHAARDDKAADQLFMHLGNQTRLVRSFRLPSKPDYQLPPQKGRVYVVWLQFGANPKWNSER